MKPFDEAQMSGSRASNPDLRRSAMAGMRGFFRFWGGMKQVIGLGLLYSRHGIHTRRLIEAAPVPEPARARASSPGLSGKVRSPIHPVRSRLGPLVLRYIGGEHLVAGQVTA
jgi:hypothetical protein